MYLDFQSEEERLDLEGKVLAAAFKQSFELGDSAGAALAHKGLCHILQLRLFAGASAYPATLPASSAETVTSGQGAPAPKAPLGGPLDYLDLSTCSSSSSSASAAAPATPLPARHAAREAAPPPALKGQAGQLTSQTFYEILGVNKLSSFENIHQAFLRKVKRHLLGRLQLKEVSAREVMQFRDLLRAYCVAHDILKDPITRTDYDLRSMGMRNRASIETPEDGKAGGLARLMIGEVLECAEILTASELQVALDMHKAEPGIQFGQFLVQAAFLDQQTLDAAIIGQRLVNSGKITIAQFQKAMQAMKADGVPFADTLTGEGWLEAKDINPPEATEIASDEPTMKIREIAVDTSAKTNDSKISLGGQKSAWADQIDWGDS